MLVPVRKTKRGLKSTGRALTPEQEKVKAEIEEERARLEGLRDQRDREVETLKKAGTTPEELRKVHERYKKLINKQETEAEPKTLQSTPQAQPTETKIPGVSLGEAAGYSERRGRVHAGRDIPAPSGQPLIVQTDSIIQDTGYDPGYGNYVVFKDANGLEHMYGHMITPTTYRKGDAVSAGTVVGNVGSTGRSSGPHLHWEVSPNIGEVGFKRSNVFDPILDYGFNQNSPFAAGNLATKKPESQAEEIAKQTSYEEPGDQEVLVTMPPPAAPPATALTSSSFSFAAGWYMGTMAHSRMTPSSPISKHKGEARPSNLKEFRTFQRTRLFLFAGSPPAKVMPCAARQSATLPPVPRICPILGSTRRTLLFMSQVPWAPPLVV